MNDPMPLTRQRPDGYLLKWVLSIPQPPNSGAVPFLIEDETPREERVPREMSHRNGVSGIETLTVAVSDIAATRSFYSKLLNQSGEDVARDELGARGVRIRIGPHRFDFVEPDGTS